MSLGSGMEGGDDVARVKDGGQGSKDDFGAEVDVVERH